MKTKLFNPFKFIAGGKALMLGLGAMLITAIVCLYGKIHLDGVIDVHIGRVTQSWLYFAEPVIDWLVFVISLYLFARKFSESSVRFIDVAGTAALARYPMFFVVIITMFMPSITNDPHKLIDEILTNPMLMAKLLLLGLLTLPFIIWTVALMFNAYSISANLKGSKATWTFIASIVIAEVLSKVIIVSILYK